MNRREVKASAYALAVDAIDRYQRDTLERTLSAIGSPSDCRKIRFQLNRIKGNHAAAMARMTAPPAERAPRVQKPAAEPDADRWKVAGFCVRCCYSLWLTDTGALIRQDNLSAHCWGGLRHTVNASEVAS